MRYILFTAVVAMLAVGSWWYLRARRRRASRMVSLVALLREPFTLDPVVLASTAGRVWNADLGNGNNDGDDGFVAAAGPISTIKHGDRLYLVNSFPEPYVDDPEAASEAISDLRLAELFREHRAWFSCDFLGVDSTTPLEVIIEAYGRIGKLFAEFLDENCLLIYVPDIGRGYHINEDTHRALQSDDPIAALQNTMTVPLIPISSDDPLLQEAVAQARKAWPQFLAAFETIAGENFSVKAPVSHSGNTEFIWLSVTAVEGERVFGMLANDPANLGPLRIGSNVNVAIADLNDWCYLDPQQKMQGGFTIAAVEKASRRRQKS